MAATRRESLKALLATVGAASAPLVLVERALAAESAAVRFYAPDELALVTRLADLLIPETETPGAVAAGVPALLDALMAEWASAATQTEHRERLGRCAAGLADGDVPFAAQSAARSEARLAAFDRAAFAEDRDSSASRAYRTLKTLITRAYFATEPGARQELDWRLVPGRWVPCQELPA